MDGLRQKLEGQGLVNVNYMVVNDNGGQAQRMHSLLANRLPSGIALHKQDPDADVWQAVNGEKDDFLIYDRCGRLTYHISLPYSIIGQGHIENAIRESYCKPICGDCSHNSVEVPAECTRPVVAAGPEEEVAAAGSVPAAREEEAGHGQGHHHGNQQGVAHGHQHHGHHHGGFNRRRHGGGQQVMVMGQHQQGSGRASGSAVGGQVEGLQQLAVDDVMLLRELGQANVLQGPQGALAVQRP